jgi:hypothetical protein
MLCCNRPAERHVGDPNSMTASIDISPALRSPGPGRANAASGWYRALLFLVLGCLLIQGTAVQAHLHLTPHSGTLAATNEKQGISEVPGNADARAVCPLCMEAAMSGHYLPGSANALPSPPPAVLGVDPQTLSEFRLLSRAVGWQSRAPPQ